jgi:hypothetical protein
VRVVYANTPPPAGLTADALLTDEQLIADAGAGTAPGVRLLDGTVDPNVAQHWSAALWDLAFTWYLAHDGSDPTMVDGVSGGDLAAFEAALTVLLPAGRAVLGVQAAAADLAGADVTLVVPDAGPGNHVRIETVAARAAALALGSDAPAVVAAPQDGRLLQKYRRTRDPDWLAPAVAHRRALRGAVLAGVNAAFAVRRRRRRGTVLVYEYAPTRAFARDYRADPHRAHALVHVHAEPRDLPAIARAGDRAIIVPEPTLQHPVAAATTARGRLEIAGVDVWPAVREPLAEILDRYRRYAAETAPALRRELRRSGVRAVLVPFDGAPTARLLVRLAQAEAIPTLVLNDGFKADDLGREGMAADVALTWSTSMRDSYFRRRADGTAIVTGNPRVATIPPVRGVALPPRRVLVGGFTYSPMDLNCGRSDVERFTTEVLDGVAEGAPDARVTLKLHPADEPGHYGELLTGRAVDVRASGDVLGLFGDADVYVSTYTTSLIEAAAAGLPIVYYRVNPQRIGPPFDGDPWLGRRTATTPAELAALLGDAELLQEPPPPGWIEHVLGPRDGHASDRIWAEISARL